MAFAISSFTPHLAPELRAFWHWLNRPAPAPAASGGGSGAGPGQSTRPAGGDAGSARPTPSGARPPSVPRRWSGPVRPASSQRPLRVVLDASRAGTGRLVISGRMADVCAELERLAALEARSGMAAVRS